MKERTIPGAALAISRNGQLILARGYSWITDIETPVEPGSLFRLASVSKTLTGTAIIRLVENGSLSLLLDDKLVDLIDMPGAIGDNRIQDIQVDHLLYHVAGWNDAKLDKGGSGIDPTANDINIASDLGIDLPITQQAIVRWTNEYYVNKYGEKGKLDFTPGTVNGYAYSNYGYLLLGQIIETVSGISYEQFIQDRLLAPLGIRRMRLGRTLLKSKHQDEVLYHCSNFALRNNVMVAGHPVNVLTPYGGYFSLENMAANGGWIASAIDLVRFASSFDDPDTCKLLSHDFVEKLFASHKYDTSGSYFACGRYVDPNSNPPTQYWGRGLDGTKTHLMRWQDNNDNFDTAILFNKYGEVYDSAGVLYEWDLESLIMDAADQVNSWPDEGSWADFL